METILPPQALSTLPKWLKVADSAREIGASASFVRKLILLGALKASNIGSGTQRAEWRIAAEDLAAFMAARAERRA